MKGTKRDCGGGRMRLRARVKGREDGSHRSWQECIAGAARARGGAGGTSFTMNGPSYVSGNVGSLASHDAWPTTSIAAP